MNSPEDLPIVGVLFLAMAVVCFVAVGRGISEMARPKWMSLEQLCGLAPVARATGESLGAGLLFSPMLTAVPFLIAGCGLFPHSWVLPNNARTVLQQNAAAGCRERAERALFIRVFRVWSSSYTTPGKASMAAMAGDGSSWHGLFFG